MSDPAAPDTPTGADSTVAPAAVSARPLRRVMLRRVVVLVLVVVITWTLFNLVGQIDWAAVWDALGQLTVWQLALLVALLVLRQLLDSVPLALYTPGVGIGHAMVNDLGAKTMVAVAPPPSDFALRVSMFGSWGVPTALGLAGTAMNMVTFYIVRFTTPLVGFVVLFAVGQPPGFRLLDVVWIVAGIVLLVGVVLVVRSDGLARWVGTTCGRWVRRVRRHVDPEVWAESCVAFRRDIADRFYAAFPPSLLSQAGMLAVELLMLLLCLRFVGLSPDEVGFWDVAVAFLFAYPMTILPFSGLGVVDALVVASMVQAGGADVEASAVAGLVVWRVVTLGGVYLLGAASILWWRHSVRMEADG